MDLTKFAVRTTSKSLSDIFQYWTEEEQKIEVMELTDLPITMPIEERDEGRRKKETYCSVLVAQTNGHQGVEFQSPRDELDIQRKS